MFSPTPPRDIDHVPPSHLVLISLAGASSQLADLQADGAPDVSALCVSAFAEDDAYFDRPEVIEGLRDVLYAGKPLRVKLMWGQLSSFMQTLTELLEAGAPEIPVVLTVRGGFSGLRGIEEEATTRWKSSFRAVAALPNLYLELIGIQSALPPELSPERQRIVLRPFLRTALRALGPERLIIGDPTLTSRNSDGTMREDVLHPWLQELWCALAYIQDERPELDPEEAMRSMTGGNARWLFGEHFRECLALETEASRR